MKSVTDQAEDRPAFQDLYSRMFEAQQQGNRALSDDLKKQIEELRNIAFPKPGKECIEKIVDRLPDFAAKTLGKNHLELGLAERSNCINAAFNFQDEIAHWQTYSTTDFLNRIQTGFQQLESLNQVNWGDLVVFWSRTGGSWDNRTIDVHKINDADPDFPYGLVFDHVAVRLTDTLVFHKPDPTLESRYQIDFLSSAAGATISNQGFEMTFHRSQKLRHS